MTSSTNEDWADDIVRGLHSLTSDQVPALEVILLDALVEWLVSPANPGSGYGEEHAGHLISTLFTAIDTSRTLFPKQEPAATPDITAARERIVEGAHELSDQGADGVSLTVSRLMPALMTALEEHAAERPRQLQQVFVHLLYAIALGSRTEHDPAVSAGLAEAFAGWDEVLRGGYLLPWRQKLTGGTD